MVPVILVRVPCSSSACLGIRKLSAPAQDRSEVSKGSTFYQEYITYYPSLIYPILNSIPCSENVLTESEERNQPSNDKQLIHGVTCICEEREQKGAFKAYLTLSTRVRHCHTFLCSCVADRFVVISTFYTWRHFFNSSSMNTTFFFLFAILLNMQLMSQNIHSNVLISTATFMLFLDSIPLSNWSKSVSTHCIPSSLENRVRGTTGPACLYRRVNVLTCCTQRQSALCGR